MAMPHTPPVPARRAVAIHPGGDQALAAYDREIALRLRSERFYKRLRDGFTDPLFAWPLAAALTQFFLG